MSDGGNNDKRVQAPLAVVENFVAEAARKKGKRRIVVEGKDGKPIRELTEAEVVEALAKRTGIEIAVQDEKRAGLKMCERCKIAVVKVTSSRLKYCKPCSEDTRRCAARDRMRRLLSTPEGKERKRNNDLKHRAKAGDAYRNRRRAEYKKLVSTAEGRARIKARASYSSSKYYKKLCSTAEGRRHIREINRKAQHKRMASPEKRKAIQEARQRYVSSPEGRKAIQESQRRYRAKKKAEREAAKPYADATILDLAVAAEASRVVSDRQSAKYEIYCHTHIESGKRYVGQSFAGMEARWEQHVIEAQFTRSTRRFAVAIRKHGPDAFTHEVLEAVTTQREADNAERAWILKLGTVHPAGFNCVVPKHRDQR